VHLHRSYTANFNNISKKEILSAWKNYKCLEIINLWYLDAIVICLSKMLV